ncbi:hypothetical protein [Pseudooceanicola algae]|uniref:Luciferase-like monooxygenase n=1 Tax=Pseudooceanicola algae TaxID=1537215 RepID=A0A418SHD7_9RHOB|nr:hypothetical protein [Pseudooceanicola algae]QPM90460.1 hypothetical protein PSAL_016990 [Pseudooceanicola algae]
MKLGYLFVPPRGSRTRGPLSQDTGRALVAQSLGFAEFYAAPAQAAGATGDLSGAETLPLLQILPTPVSAPIPKLALVDCARSGELVRPTGPLTAPQARDDVVLGQSLAGHLPFSVSWVGADMLSRHWSTHVTACTYAARKACPADWRVARTVLIDKDAGLAEAMVKAPDSPCRAYYAALLGPKADDATIEALIDTCVLFGDPNTVTRKLDHLRQLSADFGTLVMIDHGWADAARARTSMALLAEAAHKHFGTPTQPAVRLASA